MNTSLIQEVAESFFTTLGLDFSGLEVQVQDAEKDIYTIKITSNDSPLLIGPHGRTLEEIQSLLVQILENKTEKHCLIHLEINDYLAEKQRKLFTIVDRKVDLCRRNGIDQVVYDLSGYERKQVHAHISEKYSDIGTKSIDGERGRELHIMLKEGISPTGDTTPQPSNDDLESLDLDGTNI